MSAIFTAVKLKKISSYFIYKDNISSFNYGSDHPMKPKRISLTHDLIVTYDLYTDLNVYVFQKFLFL